MKAFLPLIIMIFSISNTSSQTIQKELFQDLEYRLIGPFRGGRTVGAVGIPSMPGTFFIGVNNGGVWKTDDFGRTWNPIFDSAPTGSVGDIAVFQSDPDIIYVGTGEGLHRPDLAVGDGIFKTIDGGKNWKHIGLSDVQQVGRIIVHPENSDIVFVAGLGHPYGANEERGVFKSTNGGETWEKVLYINNTTGAIQVEFDFQNPEVIYADMWEHQEGPWENAKFSGPNSGLYKSVDGGQSWQKLSKGLPTADQGLGRIGIGISPSDPNRLYATVDARENPGLYRSNDAGENWRLIQTDRRIWGRAGDFGELKVHPNDPDIVFSGNIASYKSKDGGNTWTSIKGAPGGDDYHRIWINPENPEIMLFAADQGATITVNGGKTWSSWYNQPTSQLYHISTDNQFPYWVYGGQQESGAIAVASRGNGGQISFREFIGVGADEYAYVAPDPNNPDIIYGGRLIKFNKKTGQSQLVAPEILRSKDTRFLRTMPLLFHPADNKILLFGTNKLWKTSDGAQTWELISPDLTRSKPEVPESVGTYTSEEYENMPQRAIIYALGPSHINKDIIWAGTDDGLVHLTLDGGKSWSDVTPKEVSSWDKISQIDASHFDEKTAYIAVNAIRKDNMKPLIFKTSDGGKSWTKIVNGMNPMGPVNVVREDHIKPGLLFAGTEREVYFSLDEGNNWTNLRLNMPASSIRDLVIHDNDLVIGTHGRSIWILDDINPLRKISSNSENIKTSLLKPSNAYRVRDNMFTDTPLPPEEPTGTNPPEGAIIDYVLAKQAQDVQLRISDLDGNTIMVYSNKDEFEKIDSTSLPHPTYWIKPNQKISTSQGHHRFIWNLKYEDPKGANRNFSIAAVKNSTPIGPVGPLVHPGFYNVELSVDGIIFSEQIEVKLDPRVLISSNDLEIQTNLSLKCYNNYHVLQEMRERIDAELANDDISSNQTTALEHLKGRGNPRDGNIIYGRISESDIEDENIVGLQSKLLHLLLVFQSADVKPTASAIQASEILNQRTYELKEKLDRILMN